MKKKIMTLEQFADIIGINVVCTRYANQESRYCVHFNDGEIKTGSILTSSYGDGKTYDEAARAYAQKISGHLLVVGAWSRDQRKEFNVPKDLT